MVYQVDKNISSKHTNPMFSKKFSNRDLSEIDIGVSGNVIDKFWFLIYKDTSAATPLFCLDTLPLPLADLLFIFSLFFLYTD